MSPRGVAIPQVREQLLRAAERVLAREGPAGLTSRAITSEAGCAKGLIYNYFADLDDLLEELAVDRFRLIAGKAAELPLHAGQGTVAGNLAAAALALPGPEGFAIATLLVSRPSLARRVMRRAVADGGPGLDQIEAAFAAYLDAEKKLGRVAAGADTATLALSLVGTVHHLFLTGRASDPDLSRRVRVIAAALVAGMAPDAGPAPR
ncbi:MAG: TetR/AcrR family transcriptional regulator [Streptosporangiaceae bacterium]